MALFKQHITTPQGFLVTNGYLKISALSYDRSGKGIIYQIRIYPNRERSQAEEEAGILYYTSGLHLSFGESVPDILRMIYEDIKRKAQDAETYPQIAAKFSDAIDVLEEDIPESPSYAELAAATNILMGGSES